MEKSSKISYNEIAIIIPSYKEIANLKILVDKIEKILPKAEIFIIDDSPAKENILLRESLAKQKNVVILSRMEKKGRGSAVIDGFGLAFKNKNINYFIEMDSDLAHDPEEIAKFILKLRHDQYDLIVGSRFLKGGNTKNYSKKRILFSKIINKFLYYWLAIHLTDHTSGFRMYSRKAVGLLLKSKPKSTGFITLSETAFILKKANLKITEVPISVSKRLNGKSTFGLSELTNALSFVIWLRLNSLFNNR